MTSPRIPLLVASLAAAAGACAPDTKPDTEIIVPVCDPDQCNDGDPCTDDLCKPDATCLHVARNPGGACQVDAHCDDGDPCTDDTCALDECDLMRCVNTRRDGCQRCIPGCTPATCGFMCDDGDTCTPDLCGDDGICTHLADDPNCDRDCSQSNAIAVQQAQFNFFAGSVSTWVGVAQPTARSCDDGACACASELQLVDASPGVVFGFPVSGPEGDASAWSCDVAPCDVTSVSCDPLLAGVGYVAWGTIHYASEPHAARAPSGAQADTAAPMAPPIDHLEVAGYCLSTLIDVLGGTYRATFDVGGKVATFDLTIEAVDATNARGRMGTCTGCADVGLVEGQTIGVAYEGNELALTLTGPDAPLTGRVYAKKDRFVGDFTADGQYAGHLEVEPLVP